MHSHATVAILYATMVRQEHDMGVVVDTLPAHAVQQPAYLGIGLLYRTYIFGRHPLVLVSRMVGMNRVEEDQRRLVAVFEHKLQCPVIIRDIGVVFEVPRLVDITLVVGIEEVYPVVVECRLGIGTRLLQHLEHRRVIAVGVTGHGRQYKLLLRPAIVHHTVLLGAAAGQVARPVGQRN